MILTEQLVSFIKIFRVKCFYKAHLFYQIVLIPNKKITKRLNLCHRNKIKKYLLNDDGFINLQIPIFTIILIFMRKINHLYSYILKIG